MGVVISFEQYRTCRLQKTKRKITDEEAIRLSKQYNLNTEQWKLIAERPELMYFDIRKIL